MMQAIYRTVLLMAVIELLLAVQPATPIMAVVCFLLASINSFLLFYLTFPTRPEKSE